MLAGLLELGEAEVHMARYVLEGNCLQGRWKCDRDPRTGQPRARGPWQVWGWCRLAWAVEASHPQSRYEEAKCAIGRLAALRTDVGGGLRGLPPGALRRADDAPLGGGEGEGAGEDRGPALAGA